MAEECTSFDILKFVNRILVSILLLLILGAGSYIIFSQKSDDLGKIVTSDSNIPTSTPRDIDISASFDIYTNGTRRIFTSSKYHNLSPDVFIQLDSPNTVHVKKFGIIWADFFKTLPMQLTRDCLITGTKQTFCTGEGGELRFYINEKEDKDALDKAINDGDSFVVRYGK